MQQYLDDWARIRYQFLSLHCFFLSHLPLINPLLSRLQDCYPIQHQKKNAKVEWHIHKFRSSLECQTIGLWMKGNTVGFLIQWEDKGTFWSLILPRTSSRCFQRHNTAASTFTINYSISLEEIIPRADTVKTYTNVGIKYSPIQSRNLSLY